MDGERLCFAQMYTVDATQQQADNRLYHKPHLDWDIMENLYGVLRRIDPYIDGLKAASSGFVNSQFPKKPKFDWSSRTLDNLLTSSTSLYLNSLNKDQTDRTCMTAAEFNMEIEDGICK